MADHGVPAAESAQSGEQLQAFLEEEQLDRHPRAGVIVATSGVQETHEWARYRGGILSHELRSALSGAADVNGDGRIEYSELRAFLAAANARVRNPEARVDVFARPPALDRHRALVDLRAATASARFLHFGSGLGGRYWVEDERGVRYADLNKEPQASFDMLLSAHHGYFLRNEDREAEIPPGPRRVEVSALSGIRARSRRAARSTTPSARICIRSRSGAASTTASWPRAAISPSRTRAAAALLSRRPRHGPSRRAIARRWAISSRARRRATRG